MNLTFWVDFLEAGRFYAIRGDAQGLCLALWSGVTPGGDFMWYTKDGSGVYSPIKQESSSPVRSLD